MVSEITPEQTIEIISPVAIHQCAIDHGWYEGITRENVTPHQALAWISLMHSELSEAVEAYRKGDIGNFAEELADAIIRIFDTAEFFGIDIAKRVAWKHMVNKVRPYKHGGKKV